MAITSVGYDGTVDEVQWASMVSKVGGYEYGVDGAGHFAVTQSAGTRMISIAAGIAWGRGVMDISDAAAVIQLEAVTTGSRYDLIALRRTWGPANGGPTELVVIKGTSTKAIPSDRQSNPGVIDDQPLALVRVQAGSASIPEIVDLRVWGRNGGQLYAKDDLVRSYMNAVGTEINVAGVLWQRVPGVNNTAVWQKAGVIGDTGWVTTGSGFASGWGGSGAYMKFRVNNGVGYFRARFLRTGPAIRVPANGDLANTVVGKAPRAAWPSGEYFPLSSDAFGPVATGALGTAGDVSLTSIAPGGTVNKGSEFQLSGIYFKD